MEQELLQQVWQEQLLLAPGLAPPLLDGQVGWPVLEASCGPRYLGMHIYGNMFILFLTWIEA